ncbi:MAG: hypothetical protein ACOYJS_03080 [Acutalibacteraceae bacterium]
MRRYDLVIFGATFLGLGAAKASKGKTLIIEEKANPCGEFIDSFHSGSDYKAELITEEGRKFKAFFEDAGLCGNVFIPEWTAFVSSWICKNDIEVLLFTNVLKVEPEGEEYKITIFNSNGKSEIFAKRIIDTRTKSFVYKTLNAITYGGIFDSFHESIKVYPYNDKYSIAEFKMPDSFDYPAARKRVFELWATRPEEYKHILIAAVADLFYKKSDCEQTEVSKNYINAYSTYYANPFLAFDKGSALGGKFCD